MKIVAIINPIAGTNAKDGIARRLIEILKPGNDLEVSYSTYAGHGSLIAQRAVDAGADIVVAVGGDGTVNEVAATVAGTPTALGIVPVGSGNGLGRHLHLPMNAERAIKVIAQGNIQSFDYCTANGRPFFCTCGVGFDAAVSDAFAQGDTRGFVTYLRTAVTEYQRYRSKHYTITIDGQSMSERAFVIACCNASQYGNNAYIAPRASMQDGLIDVTVIHPFNIAEAALLGARLFTRQLESDSHVSIYRGHKITIERPEADVIHIDGDPWQTDALVEVACVENSLRICVGAENDDNSSNDNDNNSDNDNSSASSADSVEMSQK